jgi:CO/xanthine dehydrogenase FAD-binding subunit
MLLNLLEYHWAEHLDDALMLLSRTDVKTVPLAGGTYLLGLKDESIQAVVDLRDLQLAYIMSDAQDIHIGAMTTLQQMVDAPELKNFAAGLLASAALASSFSRLIRNSATIGGTLGAGIASQADLLTALAVMDAMVLVRSGSKTQVNLSGGTAEHPGLALAGVTYKGKQERRIPFLSLASERRPNELVIEVVVPQAAADCGTAFMRVGRTPTDVALINAACLVQVKDGVYQRVRLALGGANMEPVRVQALEKQLEGRPAIDFTTGSQWFAAVLQEAMATFRPPSDFRASDTYRWISGRNLAYRVIEEATSVARWRARTPFEGSNQ